MNPLLDGAKPVAARANNCWKAIASQQRHRIKKCINSATITLTTEIRLTAYAERAGGSFAVDGWHPVDASQVKGA